MFELMMSTQHFDVAWIFRGFGVNKPSLDMGAHPIQSYLGWIWLDFGVTCPGQWPLHLCYQSPDKSWTDSPKNWGMVAQNALEFMISSKQKSYSHRLKPPCHDFDWLNHTNWYK